MLGLALALLLLCGLTGPARAQAHVDLELVLSIDSSGSVDFAEFELQAGGVARAFRYAGAIEATGRILIGETAIADALQFAAEEVVGGPYHGARRVIDVSGDGPTNAGGDPDPIRDAAVLAGITINGLAILNESPTLDRYYAEHVIGGPDAFIMSASDYDDFARAIRLKLLREIRGAALAQADPGDRQLAGTR